MSKEELDQINLLKNNPEAYIDFKIPWNIFISYQLLFNGKYNFYTLKNRINTNSLSLTGDLSLTESLKITFTTSYDMVSKTLPLATMGIIKDLHCWQMSMTLMNFNGVYTYLFNINAKSTLLQDMKLNKRSPGLYNQGY